MVTVSFDMSQARALARALHAVGPIASKKIAGSVARGAGNVQRDARTRIKTRRVYTPHYPASITFTLDRDGLGAEIGPETGRNQQAFLGKILEFGSPTSPAHPHMIPAVEAEQNNLADWMQRLAAEAINEALTESFT